MPDRRYNIAVELFYESQRVDVVDRCNSWTVTNTGLDIVLVNDKILYPGVPGTSLGDSISFGGNKDEVYKGIIKIAFRTLAGPEVEIIQKFYIDDK